jgi:hypothetical protein
MEKIDKIAAVIAREITMEHGDVERAMDLINRGPIDDQEDNKKAC